MKKKLLVMYKVIPIRLSTNISSAHRTFSRRVHMLHTHMHKLKVNKTNTNTWSMKNMLLKNQWFTNKIKE